MPSVTVNRAHLPMARAVAYDRAAAKTLAKAVVKKRRTEAMLQTFGKVTDESVMKIVREAKS
jgi:hypothetical protein